jgi:dephospho-CoA kinase
MKEKKGKDLLIGLTGTIGSGKTTVSDYLAKKGFERVIFGDLIREQAKKKGIPFTRENLHALENKYHRLHGLDFLIDEALKKLKKSGKSKLLIDCIRTPRQAIRSKKAGAILILVDAPKKIRFERLKSRKRTGDPLTMKEFLRQESKEWRIFNFRKTFKHIDHKINNPGTKKELYKKVDFLLNKLLKHN